MLDSTGPAYPGLELNIDRERASLIGLSPKEVVDNVITALTSNGMIAPSYWIDPKTGNNYMLTVQYFDKKIDNMSMDDFKQIPLRASDATNYTPLQSVADIKEINTPTEVDHYQIRRVIDVYVMPSTETLVGVSHDVNEVLEAFSTPKNIRIAVRGSVVSMNESFKRFAIGLVLVDCAGLPDPDGAIHLLCRSVHHPHGDSAGTGGSRAHSAGHAQHAEHHVADGRDHDDRHRRFEQHPDRRICDAPA